MTGKKKHFPFKLWGLPVVLLYSLFFTVQVFFNFDNGNVNVPGSQRNSIFGAEKTRNTPSFSGHSKHENPSHAKIRLNKRFQPASSPALHPFYVVVPFIFIEAPIKAVYPAPFHISPTLFIRPLRGPPAVVCHFV